MTLSCIWWWDSSPGDLVSVEYSFIAITPRFIQIEQFENY